MWNGVYCGLEKDMRLYMVLYKVLEMFGNVVINIRVDKFKFFESGWGVVIRYVVG
jgi:hypothetical protein